MAKHSNVFYIYKKIGEEYGFEAVEKAKVCKNDLGLDLFCYDGKIFDGRTGCQIMDEASLSNLADIIKRNGGVDGYNILIEKQTKKTGESPRYTRPDELKKDIFPPREKDENIVFAKDAYGKKHYYFRFYNENGIQLYTLRNDNDTYGRIHVYCEGFMVDIGSHHNLDERLEWLSGLENGVKGEVERVFNESMADPRKWADPGFANILGRTDEAKTHNTIIREARDKENERYRAEREAKRIADEQAEKIKYEQEIQTAVNNLLNKKEVINSDVLGDKSLIMQLFREHNVAVPLKTQGWIINSLATVFYDESLERWRYRYNGRNQSTVFLDYLGKLLKAIQVKQKMGLDKDG